MYLLEAAATTDPVIGNNAIAGLCAALAALVWAWRDWVNQRTKRAEEEARAAAGAAAGGAPCAHCKDAVAKSTEAATAALAAKQAVETSAKTFEGAALNIATEAREGRLLAEKVARHLEHLEESENDRHVQQMAELRALDAKLTNLHQSTGEKLVVLLERVGARRAPTGEGR